MIHRVIELFTALELTLGCMDVQEAYPQSGTKFRELYVRPLL